MGRAKDPAIMLWNNCMKMRDSGVIPGFRLVFNDFSTTFTDSSTYFTLVYVYTTNAPDPRAIANLNFSATFSYLMEKTGKIQTPSR